MSEELIHERFLNTFANTNGQFNEKFVKGHLPEIDVTVNLKNDTLLKFANKNKTNDVTLIHDFGHHLLSEITPFLKLQTNLFKVGHLKLDYLDDSEKVSLTYIAQTTSSIVIDGNQFAQYYEQCYIEIKAIQDLHVKKIRSSNLSINNTN